MYSAPFFPIRIHHSNNNLFCTRNILNWQYSRNSKLNLVKIQAEKKLFFRIYVNLLWMRANSCCLVFYKCFWFLVHIQSFLEELLNYVSNKFYIVHTYTKWNGIPGTLKKTFRIFAIVQKKWIAFVHYLHRLENICVLRRISNMKIQSWAVLGSRGCREKNFKLP